MALSRGPQGLPPHFRIRLLPLRVPIFFPTFRLHFSLPSSRYLTSWWLLNLLMIGVKVHVLPKLIIYYFACYVNKKAKILPLKLLRYAFEAECTDTAVTVFLDWLRLTGWMLQNNNFWRPLWTSCRRHPPRPTHRPPCIPPLPPQRFFKRWMPTFIFLVRVLSVSLCVVISRSVVG